jgi:hypothetical protein
MGKGIFVPYLKKIAKFNQNSAFRYKQLKNKKMKINTQRNGILMLIMILSFLGCKKQRFLKFDNLIRVNVPYQACNNCTVYIGKHDKGKKEIDINDFESNISDYRSLKDNVTGLSSFALRIEWDKYPSIDPTKKLRFLLVDEGGVSSDYSSEGRKIIMQHVDKLKPKYKYFWWEDLFGNDGLLDEYNSSSNNSNSTSSTSNTPLGGKWVQIGACSNSSGQSNYFNFSSSSSGQIGQIDCADACAGGGTFTQFDYSISGSNVTITPKSVSDYCGVSPTLASPFTVPFSISGNILTLDGQDFEK